MFTGIIEGLGTITNISPASKGLRFRIRPDFEIENPQTGESISVNGACLTATAFSGDSFTVDVSPETLSRTTLGQFTTGTRVNLERALRLSDRLGGHIVSGHVDCIGTIDQKRPRGEFTVFSFLLDSKHDRYLIEKGSVAIDGISLTVNSCRKGGFSVAIIPHTAKLTTLSFKKPGDKVNIELDIIGKYIEKLLFATGSRTSDKASAPGVDRDLLARHGFL